MPTLAEIRQKYPDYNDMSDDDFASAFHKKYYADLSYEDFTKKLSFAPKKKTTWTEDLAIGGVSALNSIDTWRNLVHGGMLSAVGKEDEAAKVYASMEKRTKDRMKWANPDDAVQGLGGKVTSAVSTLPAQLLAFPFSPAVTGKTAIDAGEHLDPAISAALLDTVGNVAALPIPASKGLTTGGRMASGAAINAAQEVGTKTAITSMMETEAGKKAFMPTWEDAAVAGIVGGGMGRLFKNDDIARVEQDKISKLRNAMKAKLEAETTKVDERGPLDFVAPERLDLVPKDEQAFRYEGAIDAPELLGREQLRQTVDPREAVAQREAAAERQVYDAMDPEIIRELKRHEPAHSEEAFAKMERTAQEQKHLDEMAAWTLREESIPQRRMQEQAEATRVEQLQELEQSLLLERVSEGQQRKMNRGMARGQRGAIVFAERTDKNVDLAKKLFRQKYSPATIWDQTGVYRDVDGKYKTVLADSAAQIKPLAFEKGRGKLSDFLYHPELFKIYPELKDTIVVRTANNGGAFLDFGGKLTAIHVDNNLTIDGFKTTLLHEVQHAIQKADSFSKGGNAVEISNKYNLPYEKAHQQYLSLHGEQEARFTEANVDITQLSVESRVKNLLKQGKTPSDAYDAAVRSRIFTSPKLNKGMARGQRGGVFFGEPQESAKHILKILQEEKNHVPNDIPVEQAIAASKGEADGGATFGRYFGSGGVSEAMKRNSTMVLAGVRYVQTATKRADLWVRANVLPLESSLRKLDDTALTQISKLIQDEAIGKKLYDLTELEKVLSPDQLVAYQAFRKADKQAYEMQNAERVRMGKKPIPYNEYHAASRWEGDHRQPVKDADGKTVGFLAADTKWGLEAQIKTIQKNHPEYTIDPKERILIKGSRRFAEGVPVDKAYSLALDLLGRDDPAVQKFAELLEQSLADDARKTAGQEKHFKHKAGVGGYVGDRPDLTFTVKGKDFTIKRNVDKEARAFMQQQINYLKNAAKWTEMQKAGESIKKLTSDSTLASEQKNNSAYLLDYWKTNVGFNESAVAKLLDDGFRQLGISPAVVNDAVGSTKTFFILQKLALSPGYIAANAIQMTQVLPYLLDLNAKGYKGNPLKAVAMAMPLAMMMAHGHWGRVLGKEMDIPLSRAIGVYGDEHGTFLAEALRFAEDNGTISRSSYDESPIGAGRNLVTKGVDLAGKLTMAYPESIIRSLAYMSYVDMLHQSGKYKGDNAGLFRHADELVSMSMVDYRQGERPMMFQKMGTVGNLANTLQTFPISFYNQWIYFGKEARKGNMAPLVAATALQGSLAGLMGLPFVSDFDKLYQMMKEHVPASWWAKMQGTPWEDPKLWLMKQPGGLEIVNGALSSAAGVAMTSRLAAPSFAEMAAAPVGPAQDIGRQVGDVVSLAMDPTNKVKQAQAATSISPIATQGLVEQQAFPDQTGVNVGEGKRAVFNSRDLESRDQVYTRSPKEQAIRNWGVRSMEEVASKEAYYRAEKLKTITNEKTGAVAKKFYGAIRAGDRDTANDMLELMVELSGKGYTASQFKQQLKQEFMPKEIKDMIGAKTPQALARVQLLNEVLERIHDPE